MRDYAEVYLEIVQTLKNYYNYELKSNIEEKQKTAARIAELGKELLDVVK